MRIDISKLKEGEVIALEHEYDPRELSLELHDLHYLGLLKLKGTLERVKNSLFFKGSLTTEFQILCMRCLKPVSMGVREPFDLYYPFRGEDFLETTDEIRDVMILSYPVKFNCREDCRGLCPTCGVNLNEEACHCSKKGDMEKSSPFDRLKDWYQRRRDIAN